MSSGSRGKRKRGLTMLLAAAARTSAKAAATSQARGSRRLLRAAQDRPPRVLLSHIAKGRRNDVP
ncbi:MAG: hypothetical protein CMH59_13200, partial [Myxococcales bacterium]|nr:hypothetical protein [Myxococcales bacterium]